MVITGNTWWARLMRSLFSWNLHFSWENKKKNIFQFMRNAIKEQKRHKIESNVDAVGTRTDLSRLVMEGFWEGHISGDMWRIIKEPNKAVKSWGIAFDTGVIIAWTKSLRQENLNYLKWKYHFYCTSWGRERLACDLAV